MLTVNDDGRSSSRVSFAVSTLLTKLLLLTRLALSLDIRSRLLLLG